MTPISTKKRCKDLKGRQKNAVYHSSKNPLRKVEDLTEALQSLYPNIPILKEDTICASCTILQEVKTAISDAPNSSSQEYSVATPIIRSEEIFNDSEIFVNELNESLSYLKFENKLVKMP